MNCINMWGSTLSIHSFYRWAEEIPGTVLGTVNRGYHERGGLCPHSAPFWRYIYVCIHTYVVYIYKFIKHIHVYTWAWYRCKPASSLLKSERKFSPKNDLFHVNCATTPYLPLHEKSGPGLKVHLPTDFPTFFPAVGSLPIKEPASAFKPWMNTD